MVVYKLEGLGKFTWKEDKKNGDDCKSRFELESDYIYSMNSSFKYNFSEKSNVRFVVYKATQTTINCVFTGEVDDAREEVVFKKISDVLREEKLGTINSISKMEEITIEEYRKIIRETDKHYFSGSNHRYIDELNLNYDDNSYFKVKENILNRTDLSYADSCQQADRILGDNSLGEELDRIYSDQNEKGFFGHPVHYKISTSCYNAAFDIATLLGKALHSNGRIQSRRMETICEISHAAYSEEDLKNVIKAAAGGTVIVDMTCPEEDDSNYASEYRDVANFLLENIKENCLDTLFIFVETKEKSLLSKYLMVDLAEVLNLIEIKEGAGDKIAAQLYLNRLIDDSKVSALKDKIRMPQLKEKKKYSVSDVYQTFNEWNEKCLKNYVYCAYSDKNIRLKKEKKNKDKEKALNKLDAMIGLKDAKSVAHQIVAAGKINSLRQKQGINAERQSMHMIFTGNPGSAKTTVARLLARALYENGIIDNADIVECGRSDLVGKYVGWTAKTVRSKFREAYGGVLFIDEAYSLVDDSNSFGDEAINTIVQEMENRRDNVIVIFAGYKEKMQSFLEKNEGLKSRIAFHMNFPDYSSDELMDIFKYIAKDKGYEIDEDALKKVNSVFDKAITTPDFGNGRYVRNLIEQAIMKQSLRLYDNYQGKKIPKRELNKLIACDFEVNVAESVKGKNVIGFVA